MECRWLPESPIHRISLFFWQWNCKIIEFLLKFVYKSYLKVMESKNTRKNKALLISILLRMKKEYGTENFNNLYLKFLLE